MQRGTAGAVHPTPPPFLLSTCASILIIEFSEGWRCAPGSPPLYLEVCLIAFLEAK